MNEFQQITGYINAFGRQVGSKLHVRVENEYALAIAEDAFDYLDYQSSPEFVAEVSSFIKRNGGCKDLTKTVSK
ncbi:hypothetical protein ADT27_13465 [Xanthomonas oryzae]|uniref:phage transcriptional regulator P7 n=1 Tax=Xanthomonas oryzae TaxID=347 RepID=UPI0006AC3E0D|nr:phage transcriptional regulator P7 [Xanthomonas oryzae]KOR44998.1 hypothetical protein ADT27_13465 [Xanthomonas oryzae]